MPVNIHRIKSLGREPKSSDVVMICLGGQFSLLSLYPVNSRADESRLRAILKAVFLFCVYFSKNFLLTTVQTVLTISRTVISAERDTIIVLNRLLRREEQ